MQAPFFGDFDALAIYDRGAGARFAFSFLSTRDVQRMMDATVWRAGMDKIEEALKTVDMPLRLDNANALPTYPLQKQKRQEAA